MKKIAVTALALLLALSLASCGDNDKPEDTTGDGDTYNIESNDTTNGETDTDIVDTTGEDKPEDTTGGAETTTGPAEIVFTPADTTVYVAVENLWVREFPEAVGDGIATLHYGDSVKCVGISDDWYKIIYAGKECYMSANYSTTDNLLADDFETVNDTVYVITDVANLRFGPSKDTLEMAQPLKGTALVRIGKNANWSKISYNGATYYIHNTVISTTAPTT